MTPFLRSRQAAVPAVRVPRLEGNASRRPHPAATLETVRQLVEATTLSFRDIAQRTGVSVATISRNARRNGWLRPDAGFPQEHYTPQGRRSLRRGAIAERLVSQAEHLLFQDEMNPTASRQRIEQAMRLVRAARQLDAEERVAGGRASGE